MKRLPNLEEAFKKSLTKAKEREEESLKKEKFFDPPTLKGKENPFEKESQKSHLEGKGTRIKEEFIALFNEEFKKNAKS